MMLAADALEAAEKRIAELEKDKYKLIEVIRCKADFHSTKDAMRIMELESIVPKDGEWIFSRGDGKTYSDGWTCSACGNSFHTNVPYFEKFLYCPNCGARMTTHVADDGKKGDGKDG